MKDLIVIGGGVSALTAAFHLKARFPNLLVLERSVSLGGSIRTVAVENFLLERGPNSTLSREPVTKLLRELDLLDELLTPNADAKNRYLGRIDQSGSAAMIPFPMGPLAALKSPILSGRGKLRLLAEPFAKRTQKEDESVAEFLSRRIGVEATENVVSAVLGGIWASDIHTLSCRSALPKLWQMEQSCGSLFRGALAMKRTSPRAGIITLRRGFSSLIDRLAEKIGNDSIRTSAEVSHIALTDEGVRVYINGEHIDTKMVLCAAPAPATAKIVATLDPELAKQVERVPYAGLSVTHLAYPKASVRHPLNGFGTLLPPQPGRALLGVLFTSSLFPGRAPEGTHLVTCFSGGAVNPDLANIESSDILNQVIQHTNALIGATTAPRILHRFYWPQAIPNYPLNHHHLVSSIRASEGKLQRIRFLGNWIEGISVADCIANAKKVAEEISRV